MPYLCCKFFKYHLIFRIFWRTEDLEELCRFALLWAVAFVSHSAWRKSNELSTLASDNSISTIRSLACWISRKIFATSTDRSLFTRIWTWHTAYSTNSTNIRSFVELQLLHPDFLGASLIQGDPEVIPDVLNMVEISFPRQCCLMFKTT